MHLVVNIIINLIDWWNVDAQPKSWLHNGYNEFNIPAMHVNHLTHGRRIRTELTHSSLASTVIFCIDRPLKFSSIGITVLYTHAWAACVLHGEFELVSSTYIFELNALYNLKTVFVVSLADGTEENPVRLWRPRGWRVVRAEVVFLSRRVGGRHVLQSREDPPWRHTER